MTKSAFKANECLHHNNCKQYCKRTVTLANSLVWDILGVVFTDLQYILLIKVIYIRLDRQCIHLYTVESFYPPL
jgi:hypothetical protein